MRSFLALALITGPAFAEDRTFSLAVPDALTETGVIKHLLPRFSLKHGIRITQSPDGAAAFGPEGVPVFRQNDVIWHFASGDDPDATIFEEWLRSDVGKRTIDGFKPEGVALFSSDVSIRIEVAQDDPTGDAILGEKLSLQHCGRCHVVSAKNRMNAIGSSPSFAVMRTFPDWQDRFLAFFALKPHPAFTQVTDVTEPFADHLPSPIAPIEVTLDQIEAITAYVGSIAPADLGAPIKSQ